jgi:hypothetical protein
LYARNNDSGDWLDAVIWDDRKVPPAAVNNPLIFDLNDKEMLFEENVKKPLEDEEQMIGAEEEGVKKVERRRGRRPKRKISEIASIIEDEVEEDLDPFNYSLDRIYANASRALAKVRFRLWCVCVCVCVLCVCVCVWCEVVG